jgi:selenocysteine lyase/cysteine desulfurase
MVDTAVDAMADFMRSPRPNLAGPSPPAPACDELMDKARATVGGLVGRGDGDVVFDYSSTTLLMGFTRPGRYQIW